MHYNIKIFISINVFIIYMSYTSCKWSTIFKYNFSICITTCSYYNSCYKNICIWIIETIWFNNFDFEFNAWLISFPSPYSVLSWSLITHHFLIAFFEDSLSVSVNKFARFWVSVSYIPYSLPKFQTCVFWFFNDKEHCCMIFIKRSNKINLLF